MAKSPQTENSVIYQMSMLASLSKTLILPSSVRVITTPLVVEFGYRKQSDDGCKNRNVSGWWQTLTT